MEQKTKYLYLKKETNWEVGSFWLFFRKFRRDRNLNKLYDAIFHHHIYQLLNSMLYFEGMEVHGRKSSSEMGEGIQVCGNFIDPEIYVLISKNILKGRESCVFRRDKVPFLSSHSTSRVTHNPCKT